MPFSIKNINKTILAQTREPVWGWGFRLAISITLPLIWGLYSGKHQEAEWMAIAAESIAFIELKGNVGQRLRILVSAVMLSVISCTLGSLAGNILWLQLIGFFIVGFLSGLFKNLGDRGMGLALAVYITFIITSTYPLHTADELGQRILWIFYGGLVAFIIGLISFLFLRVGKPYRISIANIWKSLTALAEAAGSGLDLQSPRSSIRDIYLKEKDVRTAIDASLSVFDENWDNASPKEKNKYAWVQSRKSASLTGLLLIQISEEADILLKLNKEKNTLLLLHSLFGVIAQIGERMQLYLFTAKQEESLLVSSRLERLRSLTQQLLETSEDKSKLEKNSIEKIYTLAERIARLVQHSVELISGNKEKRVYRSYSLTKTLNILHPAYLIQNIKLLINPDSFTTRYAIRIGMAAFVGGIIAHLFFKNHGYWIPFTAILVSQPYFGATLKKGLERCIGTIAGILVGTGFLMLPFPFGARIILIFVSSVFIIYFLRKQYSLATFFITLMLICLLSIEPNFDAESLLKMRIFSTLIGSSLAIIAGFVLLPQWDKNLLPKFLADAFSSNYEYFRNTFYRIENKQPWTKMKRISESKNGNAFDSLIRYMQEPVYGRGKGYHSYYQLLTHEVRITRELNNFNSESELMETKISIRDKEKFIQLLYQCDDLFRENIQQLKKSGINFFDDIILKTFPVTGFTNTDVSMVQYVFIEKLHIELKAISASLQKQVGINSRYTV